MAENGNDNIFGGGAEGGGNGHNVGHLSDALKLVRKYNGRTKVDDWLTKFQTDLLAFSISFKYAVVSLDRFLVDDAEKWWSSVCHQYNIND